MTTDISLKSTVGPELRVEHLEPYWTEYFHYRDDGRTLHDISEQELLREIDAAKSKKKPYMDSQQAIASILTRLGTTGRFHRQFGEQFPDYRPNQILGMQLYALMTADADLWVYHPTHHAGHKFPHSTYFKPNQG